MTKKKTPPSAAGEEQGAAAAADRTETAEPAVADYEGSTPSSAEYTVAFSPRQVAVGLAIVAGLVAIAIRHRRRRPADD